MHPIIGISARPQRVPAAGTTVLAYLTTHTYSDSVRQGGGLPIMLIPVDEHDIEAVMDTVDGLLLTGGGDIDPSRYGADRHEAVQGVDEERDAFEIALARSAHVRRLPTMAICRGLQIVNVALGGTLVQDLPSHRGAHGHDITGEGAYEPHSQALVEPDCHIASVIGEGLHQINSIHHQAVEELGSGLKVVASAPDGTVEAIEHEDDTWPLIAVQWHPEFLSVADHQPSRSLFTAFVEQSAKFRANRR
ncbi:MAG: gamma-glutamyl-gamma-aminobutyrate hydrolase family protein [Acidimicrobiia bacterium]